MVGVGGEGCALHFRMSDFGGVGGRVDGWWGDHFGSLYKHHTESVHLFPWQAGRLVNI